MNLAELLKKNGIEDASIVSEIEGYVNSKLAENSDSIPKSRFDEVIKQRNSLRADLSESQAKVEEFENTIKNFSTDDLKQELENFKTENENLKKSVYETTKTQWDKVNGFFKDEKFSDKAEKIKKYFKFAEENQELELSDIQRNLDEYQRFEDAGFFEKEEKKTFDSSRAKVGDINVNTESYIDKAFKAFEGK